MTVPVEEFQPLVTDFEVDWDVPGGCGHDECIEKYKDWLTEGEVFEHGFINMENGYTVSVIRTNKDATTVGFENGNWEATIGLKAHPLLTAVMGVLYVPAPEALEAVGGFDDDGVMGDLDNAGVNELLGKVAALPTPEDAVGTEGLDDLGGLFQ